MQASQDLAATSTGASSDIPGGSGRLSVKVAEQAVVLFCCLQIKSLKLLEIAPKVFPVFGDSHSVYLCRLHRLQIKSLPKFLLVESCDGFGDRIGLLRCQDTCGPVSHELPCIGNFFIAEYGPG